MKRPEFEDVLRIGKCFLQVSCILQEFKFPPKFLGYLTGHRLGAVVISRKDGVSSGEGTSCCVSIVRVQSVFRRAYQKAAPDAKRIDAWHNKFLETWSVLKGHEGGRRVSNETIENVHMEFIRSPRKSIHRASRELQLPRATVHKVPRKRLSLCVEGADSAGGETRGQPTTTQFCL
jgi:hypothetical protein